MGGYGCGIINLFASRYLFHAIEGASSLEPFDLLIVECVIQFDFVDLAISMLDFAVNLFAGGQVG